ncbi:hypothetical protein BKA80DRAFT_291822 [Phyllosticta citrichinensis]
MQTFDAYLVVASNETFKNQNVAMKTTVDVVLHCGDLTEDGSPSSLRRAIEMLGKIPAELKLAIAGNHDISLDREYYLSQGGSEKEYESSLAAVTGQVAKENGVTFLQEGTHQFMLQNRVSFTIFASPYTPQFGESASHYPTGEDRFNPPQTTPAWATNVRSCGCKHLRNTIIRTQPRLHCFTHIHAGYGAQRIQFVGKNQARRKRYSSLSPSSAEALKEGGREQCLLVNVEIECRDGEPVNAPWLVEMEF